MFNEFDIVKLTEDLPSEGLSKGEMGCIVYIHEDFFEVEFDHPTIPTRVVTLKKSQIAPTI